MIRIIWIKTLPKNMFFLLWGVVLLRLFIPYTMPAAASIYSLADSSGIMPAGESGIVQQQMIANAFVKEGEPVSLKIPWEIVWGNKEIFLCTHAAWCRGRKEYKILMDGGEGVLYTVYDKDGTLTGVNTK